MPRSSLRSTLAARAARAKPKPGRLRLPRSRRPADFELLQIVYIRQPIPELGLSKGEHGTVVEVFTKPPQAYLVEFVDEDGRTRQLAELTPDQLAAAPPPP